MRRQDSAAAVAAVDQSPVLRQLLPKQIRERLLAACGSSDSRSFTDWNLDRPRLSTRAPAAGDRATRSAVVSDNDARHSSTFNHGTGLHLRRSHKEGQTLLPPRPRSSALLATQRFAGDVAGREVIDQRV